MSVLIIFIQKAIVQGICILYGALGEINRKIQQPESYSGNHVYGRYCRTDGAFLYERQLTDQMLL